MTVISDSPMKLMGFRLLGLEVRDTILILRYGLKTSFGFLLRKPLRTPNTIQQVLSTGTGALNLDATRSTRGRWPTNLVILHGASCSREAPTCEVGCDPQCPAYWLDKASGETSSSDDPHRFHGLVKFKNKHYVKEGDRAAAAIVNGAATAYGDRGGASRYFPQFYQMSELVTWMRHLTGGMPHIDL